MNANENELVRQSPGPPLLARPPRPGPCLDFEFQYSLIRNNRSKKFGEEYWALSGSNLPWRPCRLWYKFVRRPWTFFSLFQLNCIKRLMKKLKIVINHIVLSNCPIQL